MAQNGTHQQSLQSQLTDMKSRYSETLSREQALDFALEAAELHMKFLRLATSKKDKNELGKKCKSLLDEAERIKTSDIWKPEDDLLLSFKPLEPETPIRPRTPSKTSTQSTSITGVFTPASSTVALQPSGTPKARTWRIPISKRKLETSEEILLLKASKINGCVFLPSKNSPKLEDLHEKTDKVTYSDTFEMRMSKIQLELLDGWKRPSDSLPPPYWPRTPMKQSVEDLSILSMKALRSVDLVQDAATDCSIVASLSAAIARTERGFDDILSTTIHPFDTINGHPDVSPSGKYIIRLNFNGCLRQVPIDDRLPVSKSSRLLHVIDRNNPTLLWPALLEKAYLKIRGGYDFPGSNSGTDLWVLTGWIPEQVFLQSEGIDSEKLWSRMRKAFEYGDVIITLGTGAMTSQSEESLGLAGEHDYAVIGIDDSFGQKRMLVKNPWLRATAWKSYYLRLSENDPFVSNIGIEKSEKSLPSSGPSTGSDYQEQTPSSTSDTALSPGTFWIEMRDIMQTFESIYLNWNPGLFMHRQDFHFSWNLTEGPTSARSCPASFINNPQFAISSSELENTWLLLSKHFTDKPDEGMKKETFGFISLYAFYNDGNRVSLSKGAIEQSPYVDSPQTMLSLDINPHKPCTVVVSEQHLAPSLHTFTLSAFSQYPVIISPAKPRLSKQASIRSSWTFATSGGNVGSERYSSNPQFALKLSTASELCLTLETLSPGLSVHIKLVYGQGHRVYSIASRDVVVDSSDYRRGCAVAETKVEVPKGTYTIICSTFDAGQLGDFTLQVSGETDLSLTPVVKEGAGRIRYHLADASFAAGVNILAAPIIPRRLASVNFTAKYFPPKLDMTPPKQRSEARAAPHTPIRLTVELGRGPTRKIMIASADGMYSDIASGVRTANTDLRPDMCRQHDMWLMLERLGGFASNDRPEERVSIDMWADVGEAVDFGVWREWER